ncbi:MAG: tetratricopeptide repeat protein [Bacteroidia bacterium]|nr:tetratricopeptide repeat protein [Bacteroidia bacterium]
MAERLEQLMKYLEASPQDSFLLYSVAYEHLQAGRLETALDYFGQLRASDPDYTGLYYHLGKTLLQLGREAEALEAYEAGIETASRLRDRHALGELQRARQQVEDERW